MKRPSIAAGQRIHRWTVLKYIGTTRGVSMWLCRCDCGTEKGIQQQNLQYDKTHGCRHCNHPKQLNLPTVRTHREVGALMGITWQRSQQLEKSAMKKVKLRLLEILRQETGEVVMAEDLAA